MLVTAVRLSVTQPFQRLPAVVAVFLAEAAAALLHPGAPLYPILNKMLLSRPQLNLSVRFPASDTHARARHNGARAIQNETRAGLNPARVSTVAVQIRSR